MDEKPRSDATRYRPCQTLQGTTDALREQVRHALSEEGFEEPLNVDELLNLSAPARCDEPRGYGGEHQEFLYTLDAPDPGTGDAVDLRIRWRAGQAPSLTRLGPCDASTRPDDEYDEGLLCLRPGRHSGRHAAGKWAWPAEPDVASTPA